MDLISNIPVMVTFLGALLVAVGTYVNAIKSARKSAAASDAQANLYRQLSEKSEEIARLNLEVKNWVVGGNSVTLTVENSNVEDTCDLLISNYGPHPLFEAQLAAINTDENLNRITQIVKQNPSLSKLLAIQSEATQSIAIGTLPPNQGRVWSLSLPSDASEVHYNLQLTTLGGSEFHQLFCRKIGSRWLSALRTFSGEKVVKESVPDELKGIFDPPDQGPKSQALTPKPIGTE